MRAGNELRGLRQCDEQSGLIEAHFGKLLQPQQLFMTYDNPQGSTVIRNADVVIWVRGAAG